MKRLIVLLICLMLVIGISGCTDKLTDKENQYVKFYQENNKTVTDIFKEYDLILHRYASLSKSEVINPVTEMKGKIESIYKSLQSPSERFKKFHESYSTALTKHIESMDYLIKEKSGMGDKLTIDRAADAFFDAKDSKQTAEVIWKKLLKDAGISEK